MSPPPDRQKEHHQIPIEVVDVTHPTALDVPPSTFGILKSGFDAHPPPIHLDELSRRRPVGNHHPDLVIAWFPTDSQRGGETGPLPQPNPPRHPPNPLSPKPLPTFAPAH